MKKPDASLIEKFNYKLYDTVEVESLVFGTKLRGFLLFLNPYNVVDNVYNTVQFVQTNGYALTVKEAEVKSCRMVLFEKLVIKKLTGHISIYKLFEERTGI